MSDLVKNREDPFFCADTDKCTGSPFYGAYRKADPSSLPKRKIPMVHWVI